MSQVLVLAAWWRQCMPSMVSVDTLANIARDLTLSHITTFKFSKTGFFTADPLKEILIEYLGEVNIEDAPIPSSYSCH